MSCCFPRADGDGDGDAPTVSGMEVEAPTSDAQPAKNGHLHAEHNGTHEAPPQPMAVES
jgi:hypothetical protein